MKQRQIYLRDVLTILFKRKFLIVTFAILVFAVVCVGNYVWPPTYESSARLRLTRGREVYQTDASVTRSMEGVAMVQMSAQDVNSEIDLITSNDVLGLVAKDMGLDKEFPMKPGVLRAVYRGAKKGVCEVLYLLQLKTRPTPVQAAVETLADAIKVEPVRDSFMLDVRCRLGDSGLAHDVLQHLLDTYTKYRVQIFSNDKNSPFFAEQIARVTASLGKAQDELQKFRNDNKIVSVDSERKLLLEQYANLKKLLVQMQDSESAAAAVAGETSELGLVDSLARQTDSAVVTEMQMRLVGLLSERNRVNKSLGPKHPSVIALNKEISEAQTRLQEAISTTRATAETKLVDLEARVSQLNDMMAQLDNLEREVKVQASSKEYYSQKLEESRVTDAMADAQISNIKIAATPSMPVDPIRPRKLFNLLFGLIAGIVGGLALAFFLEYLDHGINSPEDVECYLELPLLASFFGRGKLNAREIERLTTVMDVLNVDSPIKLLQVTSATGGENAQAIARALADVYAGHPESQALLVDFVGGPAKKVGGEKQGLTDVLLDYVTLDEVIFTEGNINVVGRGSQGEIPSHLWNSQRMQALITEMRGRYDHVVFYLGPVLQSTDALRLAHLLDGVLVIIRADSTRREVVQRAVEMLHDGKGRTIGAVLTERKQRIPSLIYRRI